MGILAASIHPVDTKSTRQVIVEAAASLINSQGQGLDGLTIRAVAQASNFGKSTVVHHVNGKDGLVDAVHVLAIESFCHAVAPNILAAMSLAGLGSPGEDQIAGKTVDLRTSERTLALEHFRREFPGFWEILRFRRCPTFSEDDAPYAWHFLGIITNGAVPSGGYPRTVDLLAHQALSLHEWSDFLDRYENARIVGRVPTAKYWGALFDR